MKAWPRGWRVHHGRDPEKELRRLNRGFQRVSRRADRAGRLRRLYRWARVWGLPLGAGVTAVCVALATQPWPPLTTVRHVLAAPNCAAARAVKGL